MVEFSVRRRDASITIDLARSTPNRLVRLDESAASASLLMAGILHSDEPRSGNNALRA